MSHHEPPVYQGPPFKYVCARCERTRAEVEAAHRPEDPEAAAPPPVWHRYPLYDHAELCADCANVFRAVRKESIVSFEEFLQGIGSMESS